MTKRGAAIRRNKGVFLFFIKFICCNSNHPYPDRQVNGCKTSVKERKFFVAQSVNRLFVLFLIMKYRFLFLLPVATLIIFLTVYASRKDSQNGPQQTYITALRMIGHKLLLSAGDTKSRVMPVKQVEANKFRVDFEYPLSLEPDSIFYIISTTAKRSSLPKEFTAEVLSCSTHEVMYSFAMSAIDSNSIVPCLGRTLPKGCYYLDINFASSQQPVSNLIYIGLTSLGILTFLAWLLYLRREKNKMANNKTEDVTKEKLVQVGKFSFYYDQRYLQFDGEKIELTDKESKLLYILASSPNSTIDREKFQKEVWENEGVIVTRSLDVFISRLRKKLEKDPNVKLINVHGKGYKLELPVS
jgi:DNA-binding winged helix-turn-helix (wHTH) protein